MGAAKAPTKSWHGPHSSPFLRIASPDEWHIQLIFSSGLPFHFFTLGVKRLLVRPFACWVVLLVRPTEEHFFFARVLSKSHAWPRLKPSLLYCFRHTIAGPKTLLDHFISSAYWDVSNLALPGKNLEQEESLCTITEHCDMYQLVGICIPLKNVQEEQTMTVLVMLTWLSHMHTYLMTISRVFKSWSKVNFNGLAASKDTALDMQRLQILLLFPLSRRCSS